MKQRLLQLLGNTAELQCSAAKALMSNEVCDERKVSLMPLLVKNLNAFILVTVLKGVHCNES